MSNPTYDGAEFCHEDADDTLLLIGQQDNGDVYISVQDREPVNLPPNVAVQAAMAILSRAGESLGSDHLLSPDATRLAIRVGDDSWRATNGAVLRNDQVANWVPLRADGQGETL